MAKEKDTNKDTEKGIVIEVVPGKASKRYNRFDIDKEVDTKFCGSIYVDKEMDVPQSITIKFPKE